MAIEYLRTKSLIKFYIKKELKIYNQLLKRKKKIYQKLYFLL